MEKIRLPLEDVEYMVREHEQGTILKKLAEEYRISNTTVRNIIEEYYEKTGKERPLVYRRTIELPIEEVIRKYEQGISKTDLSKEYQVQTSMISLRIKEYYTKQGKKMPRQLKAVDVVEDYLKRGLTIEQIKEAASKRNVIIPESLINIALNNIRASNDQER